MDEKIELVAFALFAQFWIDDLDYDNPTKDDIADIKNRWVKHFRPSTETDHCGDCTNEPMACTRCITEEYMDRAKMICEAFNG